MAGCLGSVVSQLPADYWFLWIGTLINRLGGFVSIFLALYLTGGRGIPVAEASFIVALFGAGSFAAAIVGGELADRLGRRPVMLLSFLTTPAAVMVVGVVRSIPVIAAGTLVLGFVTDLYRPAVSAAIADIVPASLRARAYGYLYWAINLGAAVAPMMAGFIARWSYLPLFVVDAATTLAYGLIVLWRVSESRPSVALDDATRTAEVAGKAPSTGESLSAAVPPGPAAGSAESGEAATGAHRRSGRLEAILRDPLLLVFTGLSLLAGMVYSQGYSTLPIDMQAHNAGPAQYGLAIAVNGLVIVLLGIPASHSAVRWPRFGAMAVAAFLIAVGFGMNGFLHSFGFYLASVVVWTLGEIAQASVAPAIVADMAPVHLRGLYQGIYGSSWGLAFFAGPALGGFILQHVGSTSLWSASFALAVLVGIGHLVISRPATRRMSRAVAPADHRS